MKHPNANVGGGVPGSVALLVYVLDVAGVALPSMPLPAALALGAGLSWVALRIGRKGVRGLVALVWRGSGA